MRGLMSLSWLPWEEGPVNNPAPDEDSEACRGSATCWCLSGELGFEPRAGQLHRPPPGMPLHVSLLERPSLLENLQSTLRVPTPECCARLPWTCFYFARSCCLQSVSSTLHTVLLYFFPCLFKKKNYSAWFVLIRTLWENYLYSHCTGEEASDVSNLSKVMPKSDGVGTGIQTLRTLTCPADTGLEAQWNWAWDFERKKCVECIF